MKHEAIAVASKWDRFAAALSELCEQNGIGLFDTTAFELEGDDRLFQCVITEDGTLTRR